MNSAFYCDEWSRSLRDPAGVVPHGLHVWNGSDPARRFDVYRNNVVVSLIEVLADVYPVVKELVGEAYFRAAAREFIYSCFPESPVMSRYGARFAEWLDDFPPVRHLPYLGDVARLEWALLRAQDAKDERAITIQSLEERLAQLDLHPGENIRLHSSAFLLEFATPAISLWAAHQDEERAGLSAIDLQTSECGLVVRDRDDEVVVVRTTRSEFQAMRAISTAATWSGVLEASSNEGFPSALAMLLERGALALEVKK